MTIFVETGERFDTRSTPARSNRTIDVVRVVIGGVAFVTDVPNQEAGRKLVLLVSKALGLVSEG